MTQKLLMKPKFPRKMKKVFSDRYNYGSCDRNIKYKDKMLNHYSIPYIIYMWWYTETSKDRGYTHSPREIKIVNHRLFKLKK